MRFNELTEAIDPNELLNRFVNKWVTTTPYERQTLSFAIVGNLLKQFPEAQYEGPAYRSVSVDDSVIQEIDRQVYVRRNKRESDRQQARRDAQSADVEVQMEAHNTLQYWNYIKYFEVLQPNGAARWWNLLHAHIKANNSHRYVSWSDSLDGIQRFNNIVGKANRDIPVQFEGAPMPSTFTIGSRVKGLALYRLAHLVQDRSRANELLETQEVIAPMEHFRIIDRAYKDRQPSAIRYEIDDQIEEHSLKS